MSAILQKILSAKPVSDWPEWANYKAMDYGGSWWFYELEPIKTRSMRWVASKCSKSCPAPKAWDYSDWADSLMMKVEKETT